MKNCEFKTPLNYLGNAPEEGEFWQFSEIVCEIGPARFEVLELPGGEDFILFDKSVSATDVLFVALFIFLILGMIFSFMFRLIYPFWFRYINKRFKNRF